MDTWKSNIDAEIRLLIDKNIEDVRTLLSNHSGFEQESRKLSDDTTTKIIDCILQTLQKEADFLMTKGKDMQDTGKILKLAIEALKN